MVLKMTKLTMYFKLKNLYSRQSIVFTNTVVEWVREVVEERLNKTSCDSCDSYWLKEIVKICDFILLEKKI